ncbi:hypothetical protein [Coleofasciculus sp. E1-EBD-02]|uniref:hypothetical protein n=1 Tax=Coleofasciculus sp. E1-EBD-02 TaxID=3068481 RepID=UPI0032FC8454
MLRLEAGEDGGDGRQNFYSPLPYCLLPIAYCLLPIAYCLLPIAYSLFPVPCSLFPVPRSLINDIRRMTKLP